MKPAVNVMLVVAALLTCAGIAVHFKTVPVTSADNLKLHLQQERDLILRE
jgi:hypothetical protein